MRRAIAAVAAAPRIIAVPVAISGASQSPIAGAAGAENYATWTFQDTKQTGTGHYPQGFPLEAMMAKRKAEVEKQLKEMRAAGQVITERDGLLFPAPRGGPWSQSNLNDRVYRPSATDAKWPRNASNRLKWTWHSFRHVFATYQLQEKGVPAAFVSDAMGHASVGITIDLYQNIADDSWTKLE